MENNPWSIDERGFFMLMKDYIETAAKKAGSLTALGRMLGISQPDMSNAKAMKKPLPVKALFQLAEYIDADLKAVIAANELVTEKDEAKRQFWTPFVNHAKAASIALALGLVTNFVTPSPAEARQVFKAPGDVLYYVKSRMRRSWKKTKLFRTVLELFEGMFEAMKTNLTGRIAQM